jgi:hypothetical protein
MIEVDRLLASYPRERPPLSPAHERVYEQEYKLNRQGDRAIEGLAKQLEGWMHRQVARQRGAPVLELGAGTLNHLPFEPAVEPYDIVEPFKALYEGSPLLCRVRDVFDSQADIPEGRRYRRIVSIAVLEHMTDLPRELARSGLALEDGGVFQAGIPSEGGLLWWIGWRCTTGMTYFLRTRLDYGVLMRHEHVNEAPEILSLVRYFFEDVTAKRFPLPHHHLSLYVYIEARHPRRDRCLRALDRKA